AGRSGDKDEPPPLNLQRNIAQRCHRPCRSGVKCFAQFLRHEERHRCWEDVQRSASRGGAMAARQLEYKLPLMTITNDNTNASKAGTGVNRAGTRIRGAASNPGRNNCATPSPLKQRNQTQASTRASAAPARLSRKLSARARRSTSSVCQPMAFKIPTSRRRSESPAPEVTSTTRTPTEKASRKW